LTNQEEKRADGFDRTSLRSTHEGYRVHRDYAAHYFRWGWAVSRTSDFGLPGKRVLDVGCGPEAPLLKVMEHHSAYHPELYVGVDLNPIRANITPSRAKRIELYERTNFLDRAGEILQKHGQFDLITCFEAIEHMPVEAGWQLLWWFHKLVKPDGVVLLSTPVFDGHQAANHVHEWTIPELRGYIEAAGFDVAARYGTFASARDVKPAMRAWAEARGFDPRVFETLYAELLEFHSHEVLSTFVAPVIPDASRNNAWKLRPRPETK
jgi:2-polyprenyl-3-methyl-5-hydroxy-6-metoxy-1,4-benzoquinol methylase